MEESSCKLKVENGKRKVNAERGRRGSTSYRKSFGGRPMVAPTASIAVKLNSDGQNSISHYLCYVGKNLTYPRYVDIKL